MQTKNSKILSPIERFIKAESFGGILLFIAAVAALIIANSPAKPLYDSFLNYELGIKTESFKLVKPMILWINDGLMAIFFFMIGLEIKREILLGELNTAKKASLPLIAAVGGMLVPVAIFFLLNNDPNTGQGWGIPMATDIAFSLAIIKLLGKHAPNSLKIFLTAFAIIDDIGAVLVIALFYSGGLQWDLLLYSGILLGILYALAFLKIHKKYLIFILGAVIWVLFLKAGIHPTIAGVLLAFAVPIKQRINSFDFADRIGELAKKITSASDKTDKPILNQEQIHHLDTLEAELEKVQSPVQQLEHRLHGWVAYLIMPVFAFANAGVTLGSDGGSDITLAWHIAVALVAGKFIGILLFSVLGVKTKLAGLPTGVNFGQVAGVALLAGVGFTMALFIANLAFADSQVFLNSAKGGILAGSALAGLAGYIVLRLTGRNSESA
jgi:NhaA family Na+:H+ antiporter